MAQSANSARNTGCFGTSLVLSAGMTMLILLVIVVGLVYRCTTADDREKLLAAAIGKIRTAKVAADRSADRTRAITETFRNALIERLKTPLAAPAIVALNVAVFTLMAVGSGPLADPETALGFGASVGPRTTNGEWWRLITATFVHSGLIALLINSACVLQIGVILERMVGRPAFAGVYVAAGIFSGLAALSSYPIAISHGASGAVFGLYGFLLATWAWSLFPASPVTMPVIAAKRLAPLAGVFALYNLFDGSLPFGAELAGLLTGLVAGAALSKGVDEGIVPPHRVVPALVSTLAIAFAFAAPLRGIADVRPEIAHVVETEDRTAAAYQTAADRFKSGKMSADALAQVIDRSIVPELQEVDARLKALKHVPPEHQPLVADAEEYVRLRRESWRLRADGLRRSSNPTARRVSKTERESDESWRMRTESQYRGKVMTLAKAEGTERASLEALQRIKPAAPIVTATDSVTVTPTRP
jgi:membrane associated rhomboid family serine protease